MPSSRLAAIMFTDIVGYTAMMQRNQGEAMRVVKLFEVVLKDQIAAHGGELLQTYGDGSLSIFESASEAVKCAWDIQEKIREQIPLRIGIHLGEVTRDGDHTFGDGVNIASRIESMGVAGAVLVSSTVWHQLKNKPEFALKALGKYTFKNVKAPMTVYALANEGFAVPKGGTPVAGAKARALSRINARSIWITILTITCLLLFIFFPRIKSPNTTLDNTIAVLPFDNFSEDKEANEYLCNGIHEAVLSRLSKISTLQVKSRSSVEQFRDDRPSIREIGKRLEVENVLEGSVQRIGNKIRVTVQLIQANSDNHFWAQDYDREITDIFDLESEIAEKIATEMQLKLTPQESLLLSGGKEPDFKAYDYFLRGQQHYNNFSKSGKFTDLEKATSLYRDAIETDSQFADTYASMGFAFISRYNYERESHQEELDSVPYFYQKAIKLNPKLASGYALKGDYAFNFLGDIEEAQKSYETGLNLDPNNAEIYQSLAFLNRELSQQGKSISYFKKAIRRMQGRSQLSNYSELGWIYMDLCDFDQARHYFELTLEIDSSYYGALAGLLKCYQIERKLEAQWELAQKFFEKNPDQATSLYWMAITTKDLGNYSESKVWFERFMNNLSDVNLYEKYNFRHRFGYVLIRNGQEKEGMQQIQRQEELFLDMVKYPGTVVVSAAYDLAAIYSFLGQKKEAYHFLRLWRDEGPKWGSPYFIERDELFDELKAGPEFRDIVQQAKSEIKERREKILVETANK